ncbi:hypothetical protein MRX96_023913 [Rhipicephalus microplus]
MCTSVTSTEGLQGYAQQIDAPRRPVATTLQLMKPPVSSASRFRRRRAMAPHAPFREQTTLGADDFFDPLIVCYAGGRGKRRGWAERA